MHLSLKVLETVLHVLNDYQAKEYVSDRVLHRALCYVQLAVSHSITWKHVKPHALAICTAVIVPLMRHTDDDEAMWTDDPKEYIHMKYDVFEELLSPQAASATLLQSIVKRARMLDPVVNMLVAQVNDPNSTAVDIDAALRCLGEIAGTLMKNGKYKPQLEALLMAVVVPRIKAEQRFLRARVSGESRDDLLLCSRAGSSCSSRRRRTPTRRICGRRCKCWPRRRRATPSCP